MVALGNTWVNIHGIGNYAPMVRIDNTKFLSEDMEMLINDVEEAFLATKVNRPQKPRSVLDTPPPDNIYCVHSPGTYDDELPYISKPEASIYVHPIFAWALLE